MTAAQAEDPAGERVLVIARERIPVGTDWQGLRADGVADLLAAVAVHARFGPRARMEQDPAWKQLIPYLVLRDGSDYFLMQRTRAGADARLHDRWSIGVGGHVNPGDTDLAGSLRREWGEELEAAFVPDFRPIGLLNDDSTDVGAVHLGIVYTADAAGRSVAVREREKLRGGFAAPSAVADTVQRMETWSRIVFEALEARGVR